MAANDQILNTEINNQNTGNIADPNKTYTASETPAATPSMTAQQANITSGVTNFNVSQGETYSPTRGPIDNAFSKLMDEARTKRNEEAKVKLNPALLTPIQTYTAKDSDDLNKILSKETVLDDSAWKKGIGADATFNRDKYQVIKVNGELIKASDLESTAFLQNLANKQGNFILDPNNANNAQKLEDAKQASNYFNLLLSKENEANSKAFERYGIGENSADETELMKSKRVDDTGKAYTVQPSLGILADNNESEAIKQYAITKLEKGFIVDYKTKLIEDKTKQAYLLDQGSFGPDALKVDLLTAGKGATDPIRSQWKTADDWANMFLINNKTGNLDAPSNVLESSREGEFGSRLYEDIAQFGTSVSKSVVNKVSDNIAVLGEMFKGKYPPLEALNIVKNNALDFATDREPLNTQKYYNIDNNVVQAYVSNARDNSLISQATQVGLNFAATETNTFGAVGRGVATALSTAGSVVLQGLNNTPGAVGLRAIKGEQAFIQPEISTTNDDWNKFVFQNNADPYLNSVSKDFKNAPDIAKLPLAGAGYIFNSTSGDNKKENLSFDDYAARGLLGASQFYVDLKALGAAGKSGGAVTSFGSRAISAVTPSFIKANLASAVEAYVPPIAQRLVGGIAKHTASAVATAPFFVTSGTIYKGDSMSSAADQYVKGTMQNGFNLAVAGVMSGVAKAGVTKLIDSAGFKMGVAAEQKLAATNQLATTSPLQSSLLKEILNITNDIDFKKFQNANVFFDTAKKQGIKVFGQSVKLGDKTFQTAGFFGDQAVQTFGFAAARTFSKLEELQKATDTKDKGFFENLKEAAVGKDGAFTYGALMNDFATNIAFGLGTKSYKGQNPQAYKKLLLDAVKKQPVVAKVEINIEPGRAGQNVKQIVAAIEANMPDSKYVKADGDYVISKFKDDALYNAKDESVSKKEGTFDMVRRIMESGVDIESANKITITVNRPSILDGIDFSNQNAQATSLLGRMSSLENKAHTFSIDVGYKDPIAIDTGVIVDGQKTFAKSQSFMLGAVGGNGNVVISGFDEIFGHNQQDHLDTIEKNMAIFNYKAQKTFGEDNKDFKKVYESDKSKNDKDGVKTSKFGISEAGEYVYQKDKASGKEWVNIAGEQARGNIVRINKQEWVKQYFAKDIETIYATTHSGKDYPDYVKAIGTDAYNGIKAIVESVEASNKVKPVISKAAQEDANKSAIFLKVLDSVIVNKSIIEKFKKVYYDSNITNKEKGYDEAGITKSDQEAVAQAVEKAINRDPTIAYKNLPANDAIAKAFKKVNLSETEIIPDEKTGYVEKLTQILEEKKNNLLDPQGELSKNDLQKEVDQIRDLLIDPKFIENNERVKASLKGSKLTNTKPIVLPVKDLGLNEIEQYLKKQLETKNSGSSDLLERYNKGKLSFTEKRSFNKIVKELTDNFIKDNPDKAYQVSDVYNNMRQELSKKYGITQEPNAKDGYLSAIKDKINELENLAIEINTSSKLSEQERDIKVAEIEDKISALKELTKDKSKVKLSPANRTTVVSNDFNANNRSLLRIMKGEKTSIRTNETQPFKKTKAEPVDLGARTVFNNNLKSYIGKPLIEVSEREADPDAVEKLDSKQEESKTDAQEPEAKPDAPVEPATKTPKTPVRNQPAKLTKTQLLQKNLANEKNAETIAKAKATKNSKSKKETTDSKISKKPGSYEDNLDFVLKTPKRDLKENDKNKDIFKNVLDVIVDKISKKGYSTLSGKELAFNDAFTSDINKALIELKDGKKIEIPKTLLETSSYQDLIKNYKTELGGKYKDRFDSIIRNAKEGKPFIDDLVDLYTDVTFSGKTDIEYKKGVSEEQKAETVKPTEPAVKEAKQEETPKVEEDTLKNKLNDSYFYDELTSTHYDKDFVKKGLKKIIDEYSTKLDVTKAQKEISNLYIDAQDADIKAQNADVIALASKGKAKRKLAKEEIKIEKDIKNSGDGGIDYFESIKLLSDSEVEDSYYTTEKQEYNENIEKLNEKLREKRSEITKAVNDFEATKITEKDTYRVLSRKLKNKNTYTEETVKSEKATGFDVIKSVNKQKRQLKEGLDFERGPEWVKEKLIRAARKGDITPEARDLAIDLINSNPEIFEDLGISITKKPDITSQTDGFYTPSGQIVKIYKGSTILAAAHELLHHTERFLPVEIREKIVQEWAKGVTKKQKEILQELKNEKDPKKIEILSNTFLYLDLTKLFNTADTYSKKKEISKLLSKTFKALNSDPLYQYYNPSEWWAVNASEILQKNKNELPTNFVGRVKSFYQNIINTIKTVFGFNKTASVEKGLKAIFDKTTYNEVFDGMLTSMPFKEVDSGLRTPERTKELLANIIPDNIKVAFKEVLKAPNGQQILGQFSKALNEIALKTKDGLSSISVAGHEAFHGIFDLIKEKYPDVLATIEKQLLRKTAIIEPGGLPVKITAENSMQYLLHRHGYKIEELRDGTITKEKLLEEELADDFGEYWQGRIADKEGKALKPKIKNFFSDLYNAVKFHLGFGNQIQYLYNQIEKGAFVNGKELKTDAEVSDALKKAKREVKMSSFLGNMRALVEANIAAKEIPTVKGSPESQAKYEKKNAYINQLAIEATDLGFKVIVSVDKGNGLSNINIETPRGIISFHLPTLEINSETGKAVLKTKNFEGQDVQTTFKYDPNYRMLERNKEILKDFAKTTGKGYNDLIKEQNQAVADSRNFNEAKIKLLGQDLESGQLNSSVTTDRVSNTQDISFKRDKDEITPEGKLAAIQQKFAQKYKKPIDSTGAKAGLGYIDVVKNYLTNNAEGKVNEDAGAFGKLPPEQQTKLLNQARFNELTAILNKGVGDLDKVKAVISTSSEQGKDNIEQVDGTTRKFNETEIAKIYDSFNEVKPNSENIKGGNAFQNFFRDFRSISGAIKRFTKGLKYMGQEIKGAAENNILGLIDVGSKDNATPIAKLWVEFEKKMSTFDFKTRKQIKESSILIYAIDSKGNPVDRPTTFGVNVRDFNDLQTEYKKMSTGENADTFVDLYYYTKDGQEQSIKSILEELSKNPKADNPLVDKNGNLLKQNFIVKSKIKRDLLDAMHAEYMNLPKDVKAGIKALRKAYNKQGEIAKDQQITRGTSKNYGPAYLKIENALNLEDASNGSKISIGSKITSFNDMAQLIKGKVVTEGYFNPYEAIPKELTRLSNIIHKKVTFETLKNLTDKAGRKLLISKFEYLNLSDAEKLQYDQNILGFENNQHIIVKIKGEDYYINPFLKKYFYEPKNITLGDSNGALRAFQQLTNIATSNLFSGIGSAVKNSVQEGTGLVVDKFSSEVILNAASLAGNKIGKGGKGDLQSHVNDYLDANIASLNPENLLDIDTDPTFTSIGAGDKVDQVVKTGLEVARKTVGASPVYIGNLAKKVYDPIASAKIKSRIIDLIKAAGIDVNKATHEDVHTALLQARNLGIIKPLELGSINSKKVRSILTKYAVPASIGLAFMTGGTSLVLPIGFAVSAIYNLETLGSNIKNYKQFSKAEKIVLQGQVLSEVLKVAATLAIMAYIKGADDRKKNRDINKALKGSKRSDPFDTGLGMIDDLLTATVTIGNVNVNLSELIPNNGLTGLIYLASVANQQYRSVANLDSKTPDDRNAVLRATSALLKTANSTFVPKIVDQIISVISAYVDPRDLKGNNTNAISDVKPELTKILGKIFNQDPKNVGLVQKENIRMLEDALGRFKENKTPAVINPNDNLIKILTGSTIQNPDDVAGNINATNQQLANTKATIQRDLANGKITQDEADKKYKALEKQANLAGTTTDNITAAFKPGGGGGSSRGGSGSGAKSSSKFKSNIKSDLKAQNRITASIAKSQSRINKAKLAATKARTKVTKSKTLKVAKAPKPASSKFRAGVKLSSSKSSSVKFSSPKITVPKFKAAKSPFYKPIFSKPTQVNEITISKLAAVKKTKNSKIEGAKQTKTSNIGSAKTGAIRSGIRFKSNPISAKQIQIARARK